MPAGTNNFTTEKLVQILTVAREPITNAAVSERCGIDKTTVDGWLRQGRENPESSYGEFARAWYAIRPPQQRVDEPQRSDTAAFVMGSRATVSIWTSFSVVKLFVPAGMVLSYFNPHRVKPWRRHLG